jgi:flagellar biosynthesis/type III secretory pathway chaperone
MFFQQVIDALRAELNEYGGLLHLFQQQQQFVLHHNPEGFLALTNGVEEQIQRSAEKRIERERLVRETALLAGVDPESPLTALLPYCPEQFRPLLSALIEEINDLLHRTQRRLRQNHMLLGQSLELARQMVGMSKPEVATNTYNARGQKSHYHSCHSFSEVVA